MSTATEAQKELREAREAFGEASVGCQNEEAIERLLTACETLAGAVSALEAAGKVPGALPALTRRPEWIETEHGPVMAAHQPAPAVTVTAPSLRDALAAFLVVGKGDAETLAAARALLTRLARFASERR